MRNTLKNIIVYNTIINFMSNSNDSDEKKRKKAKINKKNIYCGNCGNTGHTIKNCTDPTTSYGIIGIKIDIADDNERNGIIEKIKKNKLIANNLGINYKNESDLDNFSYHKDKIKFLLIRRKHSLGFMEFVRGRYSIDNIDGIIYLFKQMVQDEIDKIGSMTFQELWIDLWGTSGNKDVEYEKAQEKYKKLQEGGENFLDLNFYVQKVKPQWSTPEWGFPKGRRNFQESDIECAIREFGEEAGMEANEYDIIDQNPKIEIFTGTNGKPYKHIYYLCLSKKTDDIILNPNNKTQQEEIGDIGWFTYYECIEKVRPYHSERIKILSEIYISILNSIIK